MHHRLRIVRARTVVPVEAPPIPNGAILISGSTIAAVGSWNDIRSTTADVFDAGATIVIPGLINAHCHLDYTGMAGFISPPSRFADWIPALLALKAQWSYTEYAASWLAGARMLLESGVTTVADIEAVPELLPDTADSTPLRVISFFEMTGVAERRSPSAILSETMARAEKLPHGRAGLSPHAPYSTLPELLRLTAEAARVKSWRVTTHVAESIDEFDMFTARRGPLFNWLKNRRDLGDCGATSPLGHVDASGLLTDRFIGVHLNYLAPGDWPLVGSRLRHIVHCPRSHAYFGHAPFPWEQLQNAGANLCLGTDSLASVKGRSRAGLKLDMFAEIRQAARTFPQLNPESLIRAATVNPARALGLDGRAGQLAPGAAADLALLDDSGPIETIFERLASHNGGAHGLMIGGKWVLSPVSKC